MDDKEAKKLLKGIPDLRFYGVYIDKQLASDFSIDLAGHIEHLEAENAKLQQELNSLVAGLHSEKDINKIKADAIREIIGKPDMIQVSNFGITKIVLVDALIDYADKIEKGETE